MTKIKIFVDAHVFDVTYQGTSTYIKGIYSELVKDPDFEIYLAAFNTDRLKKEFPHPDFKFIKLPSRSKLKRLAIDIPKIIRQNGFDYAHFQYITPLTKSCKYINTIHDLLFLQYPHYFPLKYRIVNKLTFGISAFRSDIVCTVSEFSKAALKRYFSIPEEKLVLTPNAVDAYKGNLTDVKSKYKLGKYILYVSRFEPRKNHYALLRSFVDMGLHNQGYKLVFIGRFKDVTNLKYLNYFDSLPDDLKKAVLYFENLQEDELYSFYQQAELFVYPSLAEGFGIPPLEAAIMNCKVLCSNQTALKDFYFFEKYLFDPHNLDDLKSKIASVLKDENYPYLSIRTAAMERYNWTAISRNFGLELKKRHK